MRIDPTSRNGRRVLAPIAPGLLEPIHVAEHQLLAPGDEITIRHDEACVLAVDGERELSLPPGATLRLRLNLNGPKVIDARKAIEVASRAGFFVEGEI